LGLRRGEPAGLRWEDIHFEELTVMAQRSVVDQVVGKVKTKASTTSPALKPSPALWSSGRVSRLVLLELRLSRVSWGSEGQCPLIRVDPSA
jgi:integrase